MENLCSLKRCYCGKACCSQLEQFHSNGVSAEISPLKRYQMHMTSEVRRTVLYTQAGTHTHTRS